MAVPGLTVRARLAVVALQGVPSLPIDALSTTPREGDAPGATEPAAAPLEEEGASTAAPSLQPGTTAYAYARHTGDLGFAWREVQMGAIALTHAAIRGGLKPCNKVI